MPQIVEIGGVKIMKFNYYRRNIKIMFISIEFIKSKELLTLLDHTNLEFELINESTSKLFYFASSIVIRPLLNDWFMKCSYVYNQWFNQHYQKVSS